jgi:peptide/nickel transport system permease protein
LYVPSEIFREPQTKLKYRPGEISGTHEARRNAKERIADLAFEPDTVPIAAGAFKIMPDSGRGLRFLGGVAGFAISVAITFLGLLAITFFIGRVVPIDPVLAVVGDRAPKAVYEAARIEMGLDKPAIVQFVRYVGSVLSGELGTSVSTGRPVLEDLKRVFPATLEMATLGIIIGVFLGVPMGVYAASRRGSLVDQVIRVIGLFGYAIPAFWLGLVGLALFYAQLQWVGGPGRLDIFYDGLVEPVTGLLLVDACWRARRTSSSMPSHIWFCPRPCSVSSALPISRA